MTDDVALPPPPPGPPWSGGMLDDDAFDELKAETAEARENPPGDQVGVGPELDAQMARGAYLAALRDFNRALADWPRNDLGNARRLDARFGWALLHVRDLGWHAWTGTHWERAGGEEVALQCAWRVSAGIGAEARELERELEALSAPPSTPPPIPLPPNLEVMGEGVSAAVDPKVLAERIDKHRKFAVICGNAIRVRAMLEALAPHRSIDPRLLDSAPHRLALRDGTLHLNGVAGTDGAPGLPLLLRDDWRPEHLITRRVEGHWWGAPDAPLGAALEDGRWRAFLTRVLPDPAVRAFVQRWFGYCLTGLISEQALAVFIGQGANGKSTLLMVIARLLGGYATSLPIETLVGAGARSGGDVTPDLVRLPGARLVVVAEPEPGAKLNEAFVKRATGGGDMAARTFHKEFFDFTPRFKVVLDTNNRPRIAGADEGIWRRLLIVPFPVQIPVGERRKQDELVAELLGEAPGILRWLADGYVAWRERGLDPPAAVLTETAEYRQTEDPLRGFMDECVVLGEGLRARGRDLYDSYCGFCREAAVEPRSGTIFGKRLGERGFKALQSHGVWRVNLELGPEGTKYMAAERERQAGIKGGMFR